VFVPERLRFTENGLVRPVAPFLEVWALSDAGELEPLTCELLRARGASTTDLRWNVQAGNLKVYRRTHDPDDKVLADTHVFSDHRRRPLEGNSKNFWPGRTLPLGHVQYIQPNAAHPEIRLRFTPAAGHVYGSSKTPPGRARPNDPNIVAAVYDAKRGSWLGHIDEGAGTTEPGNIYAGRDKPNSNEHVSVGYLDDGCDGIARVHLTVGDRTLTARGRFGAGPPAYAPDSAPCARSPTSSNRHCLGRTSTAPTPRQSLWRKIVRRAFETVRLLNTAVMNARGMPNHDTDYRRRLEPIMAPSLVDDRALEHCTKAC